MKGELYADSTHTYTLLLIYLIWHCHGTPLYSTSVSHVLPIQYMHFTDILPIFQCKALQVLVQIGYSWICKPHTLPPTFVHFLNHHGGKELWFYKAAKVRLLHHLMSPQRPAVSKVKQRRAHVLFCHLCHKASQNQFMAVQELSERSWRGDPPGPLEALKGTGMQSATSTLARCMG